MPGQKAEAPGVAAPEALNTCAEGPSASPQLSTDAHGHPPEGREFDFSGPKSPEVKEIQNGEKSAWRGMLALTQQALVNKLHWLPLADLWWRPKLKTVSAEIPNQVKPGDPFYAHPLQSGGGYPTPTLPLHR